MKIISFIWNRFITADFKTEGSKIVSLFKYVEDKAIIAEYLAKCISNVTVDLLPLKRNLFETLCFKNQHGIPICIEFLQERGSDVKLTFDELDTYIYFMSSKISSPSVRKQVCWLLSHLYLLT